MSHGAGWSGLMKCTYPDVREPSRLESEAAQLRILEWFRVYFMAKHPGGIVLTELEYMGRTTSAPNQPGPLRTGNPMLDETLEGLSDNFRRWNRQRDSRKFDVVGISETGTYGEMLEVTTADNWSSANTQVRDKLDTLRRTVNKLLRRPAEWQASAWRPDRVSQMSVITVPGKRWACYEPTHRRPAPPGVILYEIHEAEPEEKKRTRPTVEVRVTAFDANAQGLKPAITRQLSKAIPVYAPSSPEYVIIVPEKFYRLMRDGAVERRWDSLRVKPSYDFPGGRQLHAFNAGVVPKMEIIFAGALFGLVTGGGGPVAIMAAAPEAAVAAGAGATAGAEITAEVIGETLTTRVAAQAAYDAAMVARAEASIAAQAAVAEGGLSALPGAIVNVARAASPALSRMAAAPGVLFALKYLEGSASADPLNGGIGAIRAVPVGDFVRQSGAAGATSPGRTRAPGFGALGTLMNGYPQELSIGSRVLFDGSPHVVVAQVSAF